jgi:hypothetical protein
MSLFAGRASERADLQPAPRKTYDVACVVDAGQVTCTTDDGGGVTLSPAAVDAYSLGLADDYAATHDLGP